MTASFKLLLWTLLPNLYFTWMPESQGTSVLYDSHSCTKTLSITTKSLLLPGCQSSQGTPVLYDSLFYAVALWLTTKPLAGHSWLPVIWGLKGQIWKICRLPTIESIIWKRENCGKAVFRIWIKRTVFCLNTEVNHTLNNYCNETKLFVHCHLKEELSDLKEIVNCARKLIFSYIQRAE